MRKKGERQTMDKMLKIAIKIMWIVFFVMLIGIAVMLIVFPKTKDIQKSHYFTENQVKKNSQVVLTAIDELDYDVLSEHSTEELQEALSGNALETAKKELCNNFGDRLEIKEWYVSEVKQKKQYYAVAQLVVVYENISVTYTFSFDTDMKLVGFYMDECD